MQRPTFRDARPEDFDRFLALMRELAEFEKLAGPDAAAAERLRRDAFETRRFTAFVAEVEGTVVSYAVVYDAYSTFLAKPVLYLEDLYVSPAFRGHGIGRAFMQHLARWGLARGYARFAWTALDWNVRAHAFYEGLGAKAGWYYFTMDESAMRALGAGPA